MALITPIEIKKSTIEERIIPTTVASK